MKNLLTRVKAALGMRGSRFFHALFLTRPGLRRAALVLALYAAGAALAALMLASAGLALIWALVLLALFWGMGAERAALEWDPVFSLPPVSAFAFWRWHALEKKRFVATLLALGGGVLTSGLIGVLS